MKSRCGLTSDGRIWKISWTLATQHFDKPLRASALRYAVYLSMN